MLLANFRSPFFPRDIRQRSAYYQNENEILIPKEFDRESAPVCCTLMGPFTNQFIHPRNRLETKCENTVWWCNFHRNSNQINPNRLSTITKFERGIHECANQLYLSKNEQLPTKWVPVDYKLALNEINSDRRDVDELQLLLIKLYSLQWMRNKCWTLFPFLLRPSNWAWDSWSNLYEIVLRSFLISRV